MKGSEPPGSGGNQAEIEDLSGWEALALAIGGNPRSSAQFVLCHFNAWPLLSSPSVTPSPMSRERSV